MSDSFADVHIAAKFRDVIRRIVNREIGKRVPNDAYGTVALIDDVNMRAEIQFNGTDPLVDPPQWIPYGVLTSPTSVGQVVRVSGLVGDRYISELLTGSGPGGGGGVGLPINESDVTNLVTHLGAKVDSSGPGLTKSGTSLGLDAQSVSPGTYGDATHVPQLTVNDRGIITSMATVGFVGGGGTVLYITNGTIGIASLRFQNGTSLWDLTVDADGAVRTTLVSTGGTAMEFMDLTDGQWTDGSAMAWTN